MLVCEEILLQQSKEEIFMSQLERSPRGFGRSNKRGWIATPPAMEDVHLKFCGVFEGQEGGFPPRTRSFVFAFA